MRLGPHGSMCLALLGNRARLIGSLGLQHGGASGRTRLKLPSRTPPLGNNAARLRKFGFLFMNAPVVDPTNRYALKGLRDAKCIDSNSLGSHAFDDSQIAISRGWRPADHLSPILGASRGGGGSRGLTGIGD